MKFVIHHHTNGIDHFDLMVEYGESLLTWQISPEDMKPLLEGKIISASRIRNHRKEYIDYEGPISGDRGRVEILDSGNCDILTLHEDRTEIRFYGNLLKGILHMQYLKNNIYHVELSPDDWPGSAKSFE